MRRPKRHIYELRALARCRWVLTTGGAFVRLFFLHRPAAVLESAALLRTAHLTNGQHSELIVHRTNGTIGERRTYPRSSDPKRTKG